MQKMFTKLIKKLLIYLYIVFDFTLFPLTVFSSLILKLIRLINIKYFPISRKIFDIIGLFPIIDHYYDPYINNKLIKKNLEDDRYLQGIDINEKRQLALLKNFRYNAELVSLLKESALDYDFFNNKYKLGDAEYLYHIIRLYKPHKIIEIGCGNSTLLIKEALKMNKKERKSYHCSHICIDPYKNKILKKHGINFVRKKVEELNINIFQKLKRNDILFIDSSHVIRPQGDVYKLYLEILPKLNKGVFVQIHDIFTPKDYPSRWVLKKRLLWNEQYLVEALLSGSKDFIIIGALNYLYNNHQKNFLKVCPILKMYKNNEPCALWLRKI